MTQIDTQALGLAMQRTLRHKLSDYVIDNLLADRLLDRCDLFRHEPTSILNIGSRHGYVTQSLMNRYPAASVQSVEMFSAWEALFKKRLTNQNITWVSSYDDLSADAHTYDFIFSSLALSVTSHWLDCFQAWQRVLKPEGVLLFSCLGVDTLCELKQAFLTVGQEVPLYSQPDMHDVGDALLAARYVDPVMHRDVITLHYRTLDQLFYDLRVMGATYFDAQRTKTCLLYTSPSPRDS